MAVTGYVGIPFMVNVTMHAAIHATHYVGLYANDARLTVDGSTANMIFTPANWNVAQMVRVTGHGAGDLELLAHISADYFVNGVGVRRFVDGLVDLSVTDLPLDTWTGSTPQWFDGGAGDFQIAHNNIVIGHKGSVAIPTWAGIGGDTPYLRPSQMTLLIDLPDGTTVSAGSTNPGGSVGFTMSQLGVYRIRPVMQPCFITGYNVGAGYIVQAQTFRWQLSDASNNPLGAAVDSGVIQSQGVSVSANNDGLSYVDGPGRLADGAFSVTVPALYAEYTVSGAIGYTGGGGVTQSNCVGTVVPGSGIVVSGTRQNFPYSVSLNRGDIHVTFAGTDTGIRVAAGYNN